MRTRIVDKRILVGFPDEVYAQVKEAAQSHYQSISGFIRDCVISRLEDEFSVEERAAIAQAFEESKKSEGVSWRSVQRNEV